MLQQAKVFKNTTQNTQEKETIIDKHTYTEQKSTPTQRRAIFTQDFRLSYFERTSISTVLCWLRLAKDYQLDTLGNTFG